MAHFPFFQIIGCSLAMWCRQWLNLYIYIFTSISKHSKTQFLDTVPALDSEGAVTKHHELGGLDNRLLCLTFMKVRISESRCGQDSPF